MVLEEEKLTANTLLAAVSELWQHREQYCQAMSRTKLSDSVTEVIKVIEAIANSKPVKN